MTGTATIGGRAAATEVSGQTGDELLVFALSGRSFALPRAAVQSLLPMAALAEPPNRPPLLAGFLMLPDLALPVVSLARLLGLPELPPSPATALVRLRGPSPRALLVDRALAILRPDACSWRQVDPAESFGGVLRAEVMLENETCGVLVPERLLLREEETRIEAFRAAEEARRRALDDRFPEEAP